MYLSLLQMQDAGRVASEGNVTDFDLFLITFVI